MTADWPERVVAPPTAARMTGGARLLAAGIGLTCLVVLMLAGWVFPDRRGVGTHEQLGMPACGWLLNTGLPCSTCGMTTSFSLFVRGEFADALRVQPFGVLLATATGMTVWAAGYIAVTGRPVHRLFRRVSPSWLAGGVLVLWLLSWGWKILLVAGQRDGW